MGPGECGDVQGPVVDLVGLFDVGSGVDEGFCDGKSVLGDAGPHEGALSVGVACVGVGSHGKQLLDKVEPVLAGAVGQWRVVVAPNGIELVAAFELLEGLGKFVGGRVLVRKRRGNGFVAHGSSSKKKF